MAQDQKCHGIRLVAGQLSNLFALGGLRARRREKPLPDHQGLHNDDHHHHYRRIQLLNLQIVADLLDRWLAPEITHLASSSNGFSIPDWTSGEWVDSMLTDLQHPNAGMQGYISGAVRPMPPASTQRFRATGAQSASSHGHSCKSSSPH